jgi:asparagine synthase (glutamine-hydrolysing)
MCGIWCLVGETFKENDVKKYVGYLKNRGPENLQVCLSEQYQLGFTRLALNGLSDAGNQPMFDSEVTWVCNGEIYNWKELANKIGFQNNTGSDCAILGSLLTQTKTFKHFFQSLHGVFATVLVWKNKIIVGRDPFGVRPLFYSKTNTNIIFASEVKAIPILRPVEPFPPGCFAIVDPNSLEISIEQYHFRVPKQIYDTFHDIRESLEQAVRIRMMTERPVACLLSGGLDSSLIAALVQKELKKSNKCLETFSIGFEHSEDLKYARKVAEYIGSKHTEVIKTPDEFFDAIPSVIKDIESFDITTVRASVGNWLLGKYIRENSDCKVVFNGDGSDEVLGGYLYFFRAPSYTEFEEESDRLLKDIHLFDVLRSDRCISSHGLEPRTPFLDKEFVNTVKSVEVSLRRPSSEKMEKWVLREAFNLCDILPSEVLWRKKEAFSDGVSNSQGICWYQECQQRALKIFPNWKDACNIIKHLQPVSAESFYYRILFDSYYPAMDNILPYFWMPKWSPETTDPSAKTLSLSV